MPAPPFSAGAAVHGRYHRPFSKETVVTEAGVPIGVITTTDILRRLRA